jgi:hypothetical protein
MIHHFSILIPRLVPLSMVQHSTLCKEPMVGRESVVRAIGDIWMEIMNPKSGIRIECGQFVSKGGVQKTNCWLNPAAPPPDPTQPTLQPCVAPALSRARPYPSKSFSVGRSFTTAGGARASRCATHLCPDRSLRHLLLYPPPPLQAAADALPSRVLLRPLLPGAGRLHHPQPRRQNRNSPRAVGPREPVARAALRAEPGDGRARSEHKRFVQQCPAPRAPGTRLRMV